MFVTVVVAAASRSALDANRRRHAVVEQVTVAMLGGHEVVHAEVLGVQPVVVIVVVAMTALGVVVVVVVVVSGASSVPSPTLHAVANRTNNASAGAT